MEDWWCYVIEISSAGITIILQLYGDEEFDENGEFEPCFVKEEFELIHVESRMLMVDEYAKQYGVDPGTVRQWIRRGEDSFHRKTRKRMENSGIYGTESQRIPVRAV